jgi:hypothetical protein
VIVCVWIVVAVPLLSLPTAAVAPPLFVSALEWINTPDRAFGQAIRRYGLIVAAAVAGAIAAQASPTEAIAAPTAATMTLALMTVIGCWHAPALAIALVPGIATGSSPPGFIAGIGLGAAALYLAASTVRPARQSSILIPVAPQVGKLPTEPSSLRDEA